jgi:hypothetical protein
VQSWPPWHATPHAPQLAALLVKSTQLVPQTVSPFEQPLDAA